MQNAKYIAVIGAANADIIGRSFDAVIPEDSNPGRIHLCAGGVGRNIAENIARLPANVKFIGALADDAFGRMITEQSESAGIDMSCCHITEGGMSCAYMAIVDNSGEMKLALSDMHIADKLSTEAIGRYRRIIEGAELIVLDANLKEPVLKYVLDSFPGQHTIIDPVSIGKAKNMQNLTGRFSAIKMNRIEAEFLSGIKLDSEGDLQCALQCAGDHFLQKGVKRVFITLGSEGVFYQTAGGESGIINSPRFEPVNPTGAGDAFTAGVAYCTMQGYDMQYTARFSVAMARIALRSLLTVNPDICVERVIEEMGE